LEIKAVTPRSHGRRKYMINEAVVNEANDHLVVRLACIDPWKLVLSEQE
jgi:hypothetical protein